MIQFPQSNFPTKTTKATKNVLVSIYKATCKQDILTAILFVAFVVLVGKYQTGSIFIHPVSGNKTTWIL
ncbi:MAG: hypothetical protein BGO52_02285 [Sphingobacteriales bacterium 44-61]|jgi:hypothetical protein|nr:MAG: hypothetical protein BGO52_02285 [Sphingobacteriales bacterium 44-61]